MKFFWNKNDPEMNFERFGVFSDDGGKIYYKSDTEEDGVEVVERTVFTVSPSHQTGLQGDQLDLSCQVRLDRKFLPDAEIIWRRNRELIITSGRATFH